MAAAGFEVLLTQDPGIPYQQNLRAAGVAVVIMFGPSNQLTDLAPDVLTALGTIQPGDVAEVWASHALLG